MWLFMRRRVCVHIKGRAKVLERNVRDAWDTHVSFFYWGLSLLILGVWWIHKFLEIWIDVWILYILGIYMRGV